MKPSSRAVWLTVLAALSIHAGSTLAQSYPSRPIRVVVPFAPGAALDNLARLVGQHMADALKQAVVIENRPGADGRIGTDLVAKAAPGGYTVFLAPSSLAVGPALHRQLPFDAAKDLAPVSQLMATTMLLRAAPAGSRQSPQRPAGQGASRSPATRSSAARRRSSTRSSRRMSRNTLGL